jgi:galactose mutarotase-like enzyme
LLTPEHHPTPVLGRQLALDDSLFKDDVVIWDELRGRSVTYGAGQGPRIRVAYPDANFLGVWTKPGAGFICIEPWHGIADETGFDGDFKDKLGAFRVPPGGVQQLQMQITLLP